MKTAKHRRLLLTAAGTVGISFLIAAHVSPVVRAQLSTDDHLAEPGWWPRQASRALDDYAGTSMCAKCHKQKAADQKTTPMARTLMRAEDAGTLHSQSQLLFRNDKYLYIITLKAGTPEYSVTDGAQTLSAPLVWAFGTGEVGQSYLYLKNGSYFESRVTYFSSLHNLHFTPARALLSPHDLEEAMARPVELAEIMRCFSCHSAASSVGGEFAPTKLAAGVTCEACHGPGAKHANAMEASILQQGVGDESARAMILDPGKLSPTDSVDFCGACHGTWWDVKLSRATGISNVRSQPYRLQESKCWSKGDARITCVACHDPHVPLVQEASHYDEKCLSCHLAAVGAKPAKDHPGAACPVATKNCVTCHMPKIEVPEMHYAFADHRIRIVRPGEGFRD
jgi:hypothetical protein